MSYYRALPLDVRLALWLAKHQHRRFVRTLYHHYEMENRLFDRGCFYA